ncbi:hypothetical protein FGG08_004389 [Glutinoglossum americanum]|uniref:Arsenical-resistance protein n=1 Tax=Glutinoglossum americanum TaxID=1670608 RepID=A0A9P8HWI8_9PEZI|nr:hypothetical protein FGG08_004389 [Glutinoglossum americanum]
MSASPLPTPTPSPSDTDPQSPKLESQPSPPAPPPLASPPPPAYKRLSILDRFLALWILLAMVIGVLLGNFVDGVGEKLQAGRFVGVAVPIAVGLLVMMYPILCKVRYEVLHRVFRTRELWTQILFSVVVNWIVAPLVMVLVWNDLAGGDGEYCAILVAFNSILQIVLYAPLAVFFVNVIGGNPETAVIINYSVVARSVAVFLGIPLGAAVLTRFALRRIFGSEWYDKKFVKWASPFSLLGLLFTILILFASQGRQVVHQIVAVVRVSCPLIVYFAFIFSLTLFVCHRFGFGYRLECTQSFTAASNNFELAIAVAVATFGINSDQALAATVGPLIEVPVLLGLVYFVKWLGQRRSWKG